MAILRVKSINIYFPFQRNLKKKLYFRRQRNKHGVVSVEFVAFLRASLAKLAGLKYIKPDLIDMEFWAKMPLKFNAIKYYDKSLVIKTKQILNLPLIISLFYSIGRIGPRRLTTPARESG